jgi:ribonuclease P protein component
MPNKQKKNTTLINNCIEISLNDSAGPFSSIKISIPKKIVKSAVQRNRIKRQIKEIYRINFQKGLNKNFLVKFKREDCVFKQELEEFFLNV